MYALSFPPQSFADKQRISQLYEEERKRNLENENKIRAVMQTIKVRGGAGRCLHSVTGPETAGMPPAIPPDDHRKITWN